MTFINYASREINCKIVYYGPGLGGKTTNLAMLHERLVTEHRGRLVTLETADDRTLFFDMLPLLWHVNHPMLPGFASSATPSGVVDYHPAREQVLLARRFVEPIVGLESSARRFASGESDVEVPVSGGDEIGRLAWISLP